MFIPKKFNVSPGIKGPVNNQHQQSSDHFRGYPQHFDDKFQKLMVRSHTESFNSFVSNLQIIADTAPLVHFNEFSVKYKSLQLGIPCSYPQVCRDSCISYESPLSAVLEISYKGDVIYQTVTIGTIPIMVGAQISHTGSLNRQTKPLIAEDETDFGGYFIINGVEKILRMLVANRRNYMVSMERTAFYKRGSNFTKYGISFKSVREDERGQTLILHALKDGSATLRVLIDKREYFIPVAILLRALKQTSDKEIYTKIVTLRNKSETTEEKAQNLYITERVQMMLRDHHKNSIWKRDTAVEYIGKNFRAILPQYFQDKSDFEAGEYFLKRHIFWHLTDFEDKYNLIIELIHQLYLLTMGTIQPDNNDSTANHEVLLPGHLLTMFISECCENFLTSVSYAVQKRYKPLEEKNNIQEFIDKYPIFRQSSFAGVKTLLSTGNLISTTGLDLLQINGFAVTADRLNFVRFMAHFRSIHRGAFFTEMKTTAVRKMLPESFGFLCVVHTPDGGPCGLLNHLCSGCDIVQKCDVFGQSTIEQIIRSAGLVKYDEYEGFEGCSSVPVMLDGKLLGFLPEVGLIDDEGRSGHIYNLINQLRLLKSNGTISNRTEIVYIPHNNKIRMKGQLSLYTTASRYSRKVHSLLSDRLEYIGSQEQLFLDIAMLQNEIRVPYTTHQELSPISMLSTVASLVPWPDHNQSPRNMYECQMLKQTMGFPARSMDYRIESKSYRIMTPQRPMIRTVMHDKGGFDTHPTGTNVIVGVLAYTGYDMEDACLINKAAIERGVFHGVVYTVHTMELEKDEFFKGPMTPSGKHDCDGLPIIGCHITKGDILCYVYNKTKDKIHEDIYRKGESGVIEKVIVCKTTRAPTFARIVIRHDRSPIIGDKFASRHGQKGTLGIKYHGRDMPFCHSTGMTPDLIINPHAFPSRMTIGMLLESLAGKYCAQTGQYADATPFQFSNERRCLDHYGQNLEQLGYCKYGSEQLYSGITGEAMTCQIFIGMVYYQRLRHMVNDKYQVRARGLVTEALGQPVKGRSRGGGTRFGEMERDALIGHGTAALLRGRLCTESDGRIVEICEDCGGIWIQDGKCQVCQGALKKCIMPQVCLALVSELSGMGVKMSFKVE
ncbi:DNA-directed RNA polymerase subunit beta [Spironucleus salmonicida]|uniref:DNA-directed RNA polymerase subunit beta n=1 Tax=Spironucleus salmonicida TaxID=348837 RepID=V6LKF2_9EUKA|nr:DNA-directed RNA polymerase subunit beta [Spironucleus salmonicida]|eukprot:EST44828.1 DNA-directed RNA polymerase subunit B [Spironucleus salmonicida]